MSVGHSLASAESSLNTQLRCNVPSVRLNLKCRKSKATDSLSGYMAKDELEKLLVEATANENWNISNTKML